MKSKQEFASGASTVATILFRWLLVAAVGLSLWACAFDVSPVESRDLTTENDWRFNQHGVVDGNAIACRAQEDCDPGETCVAALRGLSYCQPKQATHAVPPKGPRGQSAPPLGMLRGENRFGVIPGGGR